MSLWNGFDAPPRPRVSLAGYTTLCIGGEAEWFAEPRSPGEAAALLAAASNGQCPVRILGGGSNLLVADEGVEGLVLRLGAERFREVRADAAAGLLHCRAGVPLGAAIQSAIRNGLAGLEPFAGIPGTVGGAVAMNAGGAHEIGHLVKSIGGVDRRGRFAQLARRDLSLGYRRSGLDEILLLDIAFQLVHDESANIQARLRERLSAKEKTQPLKERSAGCIFRNPPAVSAGRLIEQAGCRGWEEGGAAVSGLHANFLVNRGGATSREMLRLIERVREAVLRTSGVALELEIKLWPEKNAT
ncbi:MAG: UDP-N-acetylmuramate dehydrogenase [Planctomycetota bacterium]